MPELNMVSPLLDGMTVERELASHGGVSVYRVLHTASGTHCIVKHISIPETKANTDALLLTGAVKNLDEANDYYQSVVNRYRAELSASRKLMASPNICTYARFQVVPKEDQPGFDVYLLAPCRTSLQAYLEHNAISRKKAVQLGIDLCEALQTLRENGYLYLDLKPENVFLEGGRFCIGDFGLTPVADLRYAALPSRYLSGFTAPEACDVTGDLNETTDLYAVGLLLYYIYNGNHVPFEEAGTTDKTADSRRISGEALPAPLYADYEMDAIIRKACAFDPKDRYQTPEALLEALRDYERRNDLTDECIVPPLVIDDTPLDLDAPEEDEEAPVTFTDVNALPEDFKESFTPAQDPDEDEEDRPKKKFPVWIPVVLGVLALAGAVLAYLYFFRFAITVDKVSIIDKGTDYLTISMAASDLDGLTVSCTPDDGQTVATYRCAETVTFSGLQPGTLYHIAVDAADWHYVKGILGGTAVTAPVTEVLSFTVEDQPDGAGLASFQVSGPEPEAWIIRCTNDAGDELTFEATDHTCSLQGLMPNCAYTLTLEAGTGYYLGGMASISYSYTVPIAGSNLTAAEITPDSITVTWDSDSDLATQWTAVCSGDNGYASTLYTDVCSVTFEGTAVGAEYTIAVSNATMTMPLLLTVRSTACQLTDFTAEANGTTVHLAWTATGEVPDTWILTYGPEAAADPTSVEVTGSETELKDLIPDANYVFTLTDPEGNEIGGVSEVTARTGETELYEDHDFGGIFIGLYEKQSANWSVETLGEIKETFTAGTPIICVIEPEAEPQHQEDPETISVRLVIRNSSGKPVASSETEDHNWNEMWPGKRFAAAIDTVPDEAGSYKLELYFNNQLLRSTEFTIE